MALNFGPVKSGPYTGVFNSVDLGFTIEGYRYAVRFLKQLIDRTDLYGMTLIDSVHQGANAQLSYRSRTYDAAANGPVSPYGAYVVSNAANPIGSNDRSKSKPIVLTSTANTPAAAAPATWTSLNAILSENFPVETLFDSQAREVPVQLNLLPYEHPSTAGTMVHATVT
jgi:hypothetical protein